MGLRTDIHKILIVGSGPIVIGQACEFDYSGTQACKALKSLGYEIVLVNSNPATIMTDPETADITYIEPLNVKRLTQIIEKEKPDALLPNLGGQSGLNLCAELHKAGVLKQNGVEVIGVDVSAIERGEDRIEFKETMEKLGVEMARSAVAYTVEEALAIADDLGFPVVLRPAYTMGGAGGGLVYNREELKTVCARGLQASLIGQVLVEESILGWEELELEVVRDKENNMITVCFIENVDPVGVHTGDSFCTAPMLTISEELQKKLQGQAYKIVEHIGVIGGTNVQFAHDPKTGRVVVIEINPRTSRSSALASKATGFPIALVSAKLACGLTLKELECGKYGSLDRYEPNGDYVVVKFARWAFEKFKGVEDKLGTQMRAVGEVMSIGKTYKEALQKAIRSLEKDRYGLGFVKDFHERSKEELLLMLSEASSERHFIMYEALRKGATVAEIHSVTAVKTYFIEQMKELVEEELGLLNHTGASADDSASLYCAERSAEPVVSASRHTSRSAETMQPSRPASSLADSLPPARLRKLKEDGFSDKYLSQLLNCEEDEIRALRERYGIEQRWEAVHVSGTKDSAYYYSTYHDIGAGTSTGSVPGGAQPVPELVEGTEAPAMETSLREGEKQREVRNAIQSENNRTKHPAAESVRTPVACREATTPIDAKASIPNGGVATLSDAKSQRRGNNARKVMILGGGPNRIGQGIEFDYCCVHAAQELRRLGFETIIVNCNPETVSTDYDTSDRLYFEPLTLEDVLSIYRHESPAGVIAQFGGQTPLNLANSLKENGVTILGTQPEVIDLAEDRDRFRNMMDKLGIPMPESGMATTVEEAVAIAARIGYPVMVRPSYVLGGRGMEVVYDDESMEDYMKAAVGVTPDRPILIDRFLDHALECEADAIADGAHAFVPAVMEHIELAGIHSGDSACIIPSRHIPGDLLRTIEDYTRKIAEEMHVVGLMNMQYAIENDVVYCLEANPRASRTVPLVSKVCGIRMVPLAIDLITAPLTGNSSPVPSLKREDIPYYGIKEAVFPFNMFQEVDPVLGPEMRSTGEVLGLAQTAGEAYLKAIEASGVPLPSSGTVLISVNKKDKPEVPQIAKIFHDCGFQIMATGRTCDLIESCDIPVERVKKLHEGRPHIIDKMTNGEIQLIINSPVGKQSAHDDSYLRKNAIKLRIPYLTTMAAARAAAEGIQYMQRQGAGVLQSLQAWHETV